MDNSRLCSSCDYGYAYSQGDEYNDEQKEDYVAEYTNQEINELLGIDTDQLLTEVRQQTHWNELREDDLRKQRKKKPNS